MAGINNNLYPPIFNKSYMPAFVRENGCRIYFSISTYNSLSEIKKDKVQITVQNQRTNQSVLLESAYPSGVMLKSLIADTDRNGNDIYYVDIANGMKETSFLITPITSSN